MTEIIDVHTHVWPPKVARKAMDGANITLPPRGDGTVEGLASALDAAGADRAVCLGVAVRGSHVDGTNRYVGELGDRYIGFGSVHPDISVEENLKSLRDNGMSGVKVHPIFQNYSILDERAIELLQALAGEFPVIIHCGRAPGRGGAELCTPEMIRKAVEQAPGLDVIACHFGGLEMLSEAEDSLVGAPVYLDTSYPPSLAREDPARIRDLIERHGPDRVLFGSDWPFADVREEIDAVRALGFDDATTSGILGGNLLALLDKHAKPATGRECDA